MTLQNPQFLHHFFKVLLASLLLFNAPSVGAQDWSYRIRPGDNLWDLGARYLKPTVPWQQLKQHNAVSDPYRLPPGQTLRFPIAWLRVEPAPARVVAVRGPVQVTGAGIGSQPVREGMLLPIGSEVQTGADASLTLKFADDSHLLLRENAQLQLDQLSSYGSTGMVDTRIRLQRGRSSSRVTPARGPASRYMITAPTATSSVRGTVFRVSAGDAGAAASTEVVEGRVQVSNHLGQRLVEPGYAAISASSSAAPAPVHAMLPAPHIEPSQLRLAPLPLLAAWQPVAGAVGYRVEVVQADAPEVLLFARDLAEPRVQIDNLPPGQLRLLVRAVSAEGVEGLDAGHAFTVPDGLPAPLTLAPLHGQTVHQPQPRFEWAVVPGATSTSLQIAREPLFLQPVLEQETRGNRVRAPSALEPGDYFWRVASLDAQGQRGRYGQALPLQISDAPQDPQLQSDKSQKGQFTLRWQAGQEGQRYRVQIDRHPDFSRPLLDREVESPEVSLKQPWRGGNLYVRVQTLDDDGYAGPFSPAQQIHLPCKLCYGAGAGALLLLLAL
ncbi:FecR domain-containing protein [Stenotrophomonas sp. Iso1]|uniref:FecR family protein n=1 Tax=Stenotrophomonas sp. Iso1 TaxID=2977283 RepID=UPI0022B79293|nr:FecR domain-containing protein [Stenotrophomonas sp. Iso1]